MIRHRAFTVDVTDCPVGDKQYEPLRYWVLKRLGCDIFLRFCCTAFKEVIIWSAGLPSYVDGITKELFRHNGYHPNMVLTRDDVVFSRESSSGSNRSVTIIRKPLTTILRRPDLSAKDILIVDDRADTLTYNYSNGIVIPAYDPINIQEMANTADHCLYDLMTWLIRSGIFFAPDVREVAKDTIF